MLKVNSQVGVTREGMNPAIKRHLELEIKTLLQNAPRNQDNLEALLLLKAKESYIETRVAGYTIRSITSTPLIEAAMSK